MAHRIREAMKLDPTDMLGGGGKAVEADETYWGNIPGTKKRRGYEHKEKIFALVERGGAVRSFHVEHVTGSKIKPIIRQQVKRDTQIMTDEHGAYHDLSKEFAAHSVVVHSKGEYVRGKAHTNTIEGYFSILKRGLTGIYQHVGSQHLKRYIGEFDFRYNNRTALGIGDVECTNKALQGISGKRLTYRRTDTQA